MQFHPVIHRTSPPGGPFIGRCPACGKTGITMDQAGDECPSTLRIMTNEMALLEAIEGDPYVDAKFPERGCDHCGALYRGPAVYCSLECAMADA